MKERLNFDIQIKNALILTVQKPFWQMKATDLDKLVPSGLSIRNPYEELPDETERILYRKEMPQRGIIALPPEKDGFRLILPLPTSREEIHDLLSVAEGHGIYVLNGTKINARMLPQLEESLTDVNLRMLHDMMSDVLNGMTETMFLSCAVHRLAVGEKEAEKLWAGVNTDAFRDWMKNLQLVDAELMEPTVYSNEENDDAIGIYYADLTKPMILSNKPMAPEAAIDPATGRPTIAISHYFVSLKEGEEKIGDLDYQTFFIRMQAYAEPYDGADVITRSLNHQEAMNVLNNAVEGEPDHTGMEFPEGIDWESGESETHV